jgi:hypothetical protein
VPQDDVNPSAFPIRHRQLAVLDILWTREIPWRHNKRIERSAALGSACNVE